MNTATLAVAGARKTQSIVDACATGDPSLKRLVLTYTLSGQIDLERRLRETCSPAAIPDVVGWYSFLLRQWVQPFLPLKYPGRRLNGLNFEGSPVRNKYNIVTVTGEKRFLDEDSRAYKLYLSKLAIDVAEMAAGTVTDRLQRMYDEIYVDEVQDLTGFDLDVIEQLLRSTATIKLVGDIRQSVFDTNPQDPRHKKYRGLGMLHWFEAQELAGRLKIDHSTETWRSVQPIATFSDNLFEGRFNLPPTTSRQDAVTEHDGVFLVAPQHVRSYIEQYRPVCLRQSVATSVPEGVEARNFGVSKGLTYERVLIFPTEPIRAFLKKGKALSPKSACGLYVGATRAVHSLAFVMDGPPSGSIVLWAPGSGGGP
jgi:DNA helicase-2/ATP-dependent DNA helicase PcrA